MSSPQKQKRKIIKGYIHTCRLKAEQYTNLHKKYRTYDSVCDLWVGLLNFLVVSSIFLGGVVNQDDGYVTASAILSTLAGIVIVIQRSLNFRDKYHSYQTSSKQYSDLVRDVTVKLTKNHLRSEDYDIIISEMVERLAIIEDHTLPIDINDEEDEGVPELKCLPCCEGKVDGKFSQ
jgi:hypothetical protein